MTRGHDQFAAETNTPSLHADPPLAFAHTFDIEPLTIVPDHQSDPGSFDLQINLGVLTSGMTDQRYSATP